MEVNLIVGPPASGKTTIAKEEFGTFPRLNRDEMGGTMAGMLPKLGILLSNCSGAVLDNLFTTAADRKPFIKLAKEYGATVNCTQINLSIEDCTINACIRMMKNYGKILTPDEIKKSKNPNDIPPSVLFKYRKNFEKPSLSEGFDSIDIVSGYKHEFTGTNKALILDYDGTLRGYTVGKYPRSIDQIKILPGRKEKLAEYKANGYLLLGISNQSGIAKGEVTEAEARECFEYTNAQLGAEIKYEYCPHRIPPLTCFCRKPGIAIGVYFLTKYNLDPSACLMVGDMKSDRTFAERLGIKFVDTKEFFK